MNQKINNTLIAAASALLIGACGGSAKKGGGKTPPPPGGENMVDREVTAEAKADFQAAVDFFKANKENCEAAAAKFVTVAKTHSKLVEARYNAGLAFQNCGKSKDAETQYSAALRINGGHAPSLSNLGELYFKRGNEKRAKEYWESAVKADGKIVAARNNLAWLLIREIRESRGAKVKTLQKDVEGHLSRALAVDNENVEAYVLYSLLYMEGSRRNKSRLTLAKLLLDKGEEIDNKYAALHNAKGLLLLKQDNVPKALVSFSRAVELNPKFAEARMNVGNIVLDFRKYGEAKQQFDAVLGLNPKSYDAHIGRGYALRGLKKLEGAEKAYEQAKKVDSKRPDAYFNLGVLYKDFRANATEDLRVAQKAYRSAAQQFKQAVSKAGSNASLKKEAQQNISDCEKNVKSLDEAIKFQQQNKSKP